VTVDMRAAFSYRQDPTVPGFPDDRPIIIFDGHCVLCSGWANFVLRHDHLGKYRLLAAQSRLGRALYLHWGLDPVNYQTNILLTDGIAWLKSEGSIRMLAGLGFPWSVATGCRVLPLKIRDRLYELVARNRFRIFGRRGTCYVPTPEFRDRFLDESAVVSPNCTKT
jgi:predicted DCC family thiol-disulfide oxidoreductase YuxK